MRERGEKVFTFDMKIFGEGKSAINLVWSEKGQRMITDIIG